MKYAVIGSGKTGQAVIDMLPKEDIVAICNSRNPVSKAKLVGADVGIVFVPGKVMDDLLPVLLDLDMPLVIGTTGYDWPNDLDAQLKKSGKSWMLGQNFSIGLNVMRYYAERIQKSLETLKPGQMKTGIVEIHHIHKLDAPSGTSIYIANALDFPKDDVQSIREGDAKGTHTVSFTLPHDIVSITHEAQSRAAFAEGVVIACGQMQVMSPGLHNFEKMADKIIEGASR